MTSTIATTPTTGAGLGVTRFAEPMIAHLDRVVTTAHLATELLGWGHRLGHHAQTATRNPRGNSAHRPMAPDSQSAASMLPLHRDLRR